ncbi:hypothetical protein HK102_009177, partial [Quaeritorhiza haematococci]
NSAPKTHPSQNTYPHSPLTTKILSNSPNRWRKGLRSWRRRRCRLSRKCRGLLRRYVTLMLWF